MFSLSGPLIGRYIALVAAILIVPYLVMQPIFGHAGDTSLGLFFGIVAGLLVLQLMFLGIKKSYFVGRFGSHQQWVAMHNYTGAALLLIALMHAGFKVNMNFHGLSMMLMFVLVASGLVGVVAYRFFPSLIIKLRPWFDHDEIIQHLKSQDSTLLARSSKSSIKINHVVWNLVQDTDYRSIKDPFNSSFMKGLMMFKDEHKQMLRLETEINDSDSTLAAANSSDTDEMRRLLKMRDATCRRLLAASLLQYLMGGWRKLHRAISSIFVVLLVVHVVVSFQY